MAELPTDEAWRHRIGANEKRRAEGIGATPD